MRHWAEGLARRHLERKGYALLDANASLPGGELDLVMRDGRTLVFVEVRQRRTDRFGTPAETITSAKRARLRRLARLWAARNAPGPHEPVMRIDAVLVGGDTARPRVEHLRDVA